MAHDLQAVQAITLTIPEIHPSLNEWARRWHPFRIAREKRRWQQMIALLCSGKKMLAVPAIVTVTHFFPNRRKRDFDNYTPKFILDGIKGVLLPDDNAEWIVELSTRFSHDPENPRTHVTLTPV